jgi:methylmalonyl-CoA/ethylmalonyl-CoA epimerase
MATDMGDAERSGAGPVSVELHHVGIVTGDIEQAADEYVHRFGYEVRSPVIHDPLQTAYVQFLKLPGSLDFLELVTPDGPESKLARALSKGGGLNHLCYAVDDIDDACRAMRRKAMLIIQPPMNAVAFPGRRIAWLIGRDRIPIELVERGSPGEI